MRNENQEDWCHPNHRFLKFQDESAVSALEAM